MGSVGRTPRVDRKYDSRDPWPHANTVLLVGAGVAGGAVYGRTDRHAAHVAENPITPADRTATVFEALGVDPRRDCTTARDILSSRAMARPCTAYSGERGARMSLEQRPHTPGTLLPQRPLYNGRITMFFIRSQESAVTRINLDSHGEAVKEFFRALPTDPGGSTVELDGHAIARVVRLRESGNGGPADAGPWTEAKADRRSFLVDRQIDGTLTPEETAELAALQQEMIRERRRLAPVPLAELRRLHQDLLARAQRDDARDVP